jgi:MerR family transcriptional regulator, repressor of the yfmOP operon
VNATEDRVFRIGEVAEQVGVTTRTIRYYEELGLLDRGDERAKGAHRQYTQADVDRLRELVRMKELLGLSLDELVTLVEAEQERAALRDQWHRDDASDEERKAIVDRALDVAQRQLELVSARRQALEEFATEIEGRIASLQQRSRELR